MKVKLITPDIVVISYQAEYRNIVVGQGSKHDYVEIVFRPGTM